MIVSGSAHSMTEKHKSAAVAISPEEPLDLESGRSLCTVAVVNVVEAECMPLSGVWC
jgi:hypothetical protein